MTVPRVRVATAADIPAMHRIRLAATENQLTDPTRIDEGSYRPFLDAGSVWVAETDSSVTGFAVVDLPARNVWAIFVDPVAEGTGIGRALHDRLVRWSGQQGLQRLWLTTSPGTRADHFYRKLGWSEVGLTESGEIRFEREI